MQFALLAALLWGCGAVIGKYSLKRISPSVMLPAYLTGIVLVYLPAWLLFGKPFPPSGYLIPTLSEGSAALAFIFYYHALEKGPVSLILPITSAYLVMVLLWGKYFYGDILSFQEWLAIGFMLSGVFLLSTGKDNRKGEGWLLPVLISTFLWGIWGGLSKLSLTFIPPITLNLYFVFIALPLWLVYFLLHRERRMDKKGYGWGAFSGAVSSVGSIFFYFALTRGKTSLIFPVSNTYPAFAFFLGILMKERPGVMHIIGFILTMTGLMLVKGTFP